MKETMKRFLALVLSFVMIFTSLPVMQASAEVNPTVLSLGTAYSGNFEVEVGESFKLQFKGKGNTRFAGPSNFNKNSVLGFDGAFELHNKSDVYTFTALKAGHYVFTTKGKSNTYSWNINVKPSVYYVDILYYFNGQLLENATISNVKIEDFDDETINQQVTELLDYDSDHYSYNATLSDDKTKVIVTITQTAFDYSFTFVDEEENGVDLSRDPLTMVSNLEDDEVKAAIDEILEGTDYEFASYSVEDEVITVVVKEIVLPEEPTVDTEDIEIFWKESFDTDMSAKGNRFEITDEELEFADDNKDKAVLKLSTNIHLFRSNTKVIEANNLGTAKVKVYKNDKLVKVYNVTVKPDFETTIKVGEVKEIRAALSEAFYDWDVASNGKFEAFDKWVGIDHKYFVKGLEEGTGYLMKTGFFTYMYRINVISNGNDDPIIPEPIKPTMTINYVVDGELDDTLTEIITVDEVKEEAVIDYKKVPEKYSEKHFVLSAELNDDVYTVIVETLKYDETIFVGQTWDHPIYGEVQFILGEDTITLKDGKDGWQNVQYATGAKEGICIFKKVKSANDFCFIRLTVVDTKVTVKYVCGDTTLKEIKDIQVREITEDALKEYNKVPEEFAVGYTLGEAKLEGNVYTVNLNERVFDYSVTIKVGERYNHNLFGDITVLSGEGILSFHNENNYKYAIGEKVGVSIFKKLNQGTTKYFKITVIDTDVQVGNYLKFIMDYGWGIKEDEEKFISYSSAKQSELNAAWYENAENHIEGYDWNGTYNEKEKKNYYSAKKVIINKYYDNSKNPETSSELYNIKDEKVAFDFAKATKEDWNESGLFSISEKIDTRTYSADLDDTNVSIITNTYAVINVHYTEKAQELKYEYTLPNGLINNGGKVFKNFVINKAKDIAEKIEEVVEKDYMAAAEAAGEEVIKMSEKDNDIAEAILDGTVEDIENGFVVTTDEIDSSFAKYKLVVTFTYGEALTAKFDGTLTNAKKEQVEQQAKNIAHDAVRDAFYSYDDDMEFVKEEVKDSLGNGTLAAGNNEVEVTLVTKDGDMFLVKATVSTSKSGKSKSKKKTTKIDEELPQGLINGINDLRNNRPNDNITRSEFVGVLAEIFTVLDSGSYKPFEDIAGCKSENEIKKFSGCGIVKGYCDEVFGTNDCITREQMYLILARAIKFSGKATSLSEEEVTAKLATILGGTEVSEWASEGVAIAIEKGLVDEENVDPQGFITRALTADKLEKFVAIIATTEENKD